MTATEDETMSLDAGWDAEPASDAQAASEDDVDQAWDSLPPPISTPHQAAAPSVPPETEEVDGGWDDVPDAAPSDGESGRGKRRPHRQRRAKKAGPTVSQSPVLMPRPAEPSKKHQRELARKQRAHAAQVKEQRKADEKAQRAARAREEAAARQRQTEAEEQARRERRAEREREASRKASAQKASRKRDVAPKALEKAPAVAAVKPSSASHTHPPKSRFRPGVLITLVALAAVLALVLLKR
jgi:colicin import membrane protein